MKLFASRFFSSFLKLSTAFLACIGCTKPAEAPKPHEIHWQGPETGYTGTTTFPPDNAGTPEHKEEP